MPQPGRGGQYAILMLMWTALNVFLSAMAGFMGSWSVVTGRHWLAVLYYFLAGGFYFVVWVSTGKQD